MSPLIIAAIAAGFVLSATGALSAGRARQAQDAAGPISRPAGLSLKASILLFVVGDVLLIGGCVMLALESGA